MNKTKLPMWKSAKPKVHMGLGMLGQQLCCPGCYTEFLHSPQIVFKRKFRWTLEGTLDGKRFDPLFVKVAARPTFDIEETEINFLNDKTWIPGKSSFDSITFTVFEIGRHSEFLAALADALSPENAVEAADGKKCDLKLCLYDGCGQMLESWSMKDSWVTNLKFGELDYSSSDETDLEIQVRYKGVVYKSETANGCFLPGCQPPKIKCPNCAHEFNQPRDNNTIY